MYSWQGKGSKAKGRVKIPAIIISIHFVCTFYIKKKEKFISRYYDLYWVIWRVITDRYGVVRSDIILNRIIIICELFVAFSLFIIYMNRRKSMKNKK